MGFTIHATENEMNFHVIRNFLLLSITVIMLNELFFFKTPPPPPPPPAPARMFLKHGRFGKAWRFVFPLFRLIVFEGEDIFIMRIFLGLDS